MQGLRSFQYFLPEMTLTCFAQRYVPLRQQGVVLVPRGDEMRLYTVSLEERVVRGWDVSPEGRLLRPRGADDLEMARSSLEEFPERTFSVLAYSEMRDEALVDLAVHAYVERTLPVTLDSFREELKRLTREWALPA